MFRFRSNWRVMFVLPSELRELMALRPAIAENCFSSGSATADVKRHYLGCVGKVTNGIMREHQRCC